MKHSLIGAAVLLLTLSACHKTKKTTDENAVSDPTPLVSEDSQLKDSTLYGISDDFGMSTFTLITTQGDTLYLTRINSQGIEGKIYGSLRENDHYALTTCNQNKAIDVLINITQLNNHVKDYAIRNGHLIINKDTVNIVTLNDSVFEYK